MKNNHPGADEARAATMDEVGHQLLQVRQDLVDRGLMILAVLGPLALAASWFRCFESGWKAVMLFQAFIYLGILGLTLGRARFSFKMRSYGLIGAFLLTGFGDLATWGPSSQGSVLLLTASLAGALFFGTRAAILTMIIGLLGISSIGLGYSQGFLSLSFNAKQFQVAATTWVIVGFVFALLALVLIGGLDKIQKSLHQTTLSQKRKAEDLVRSHNLLAEEIRIRKEAEQELKTSEARFRHLVENMAQGVVFRDSEGRVLSANPAAERILGIPLAFLRSPRPEDQGKRLVKPDGSDLPDSEQPSMIALQTGQPVKEFIIGVFHPGKGIVRWIMVNTVPWSDQGEERPRQVWSIFDDITELIETQNALKASEKRLRSLFEALPLGMYLYRLDPDQGQLILSGANPSADRLLSMDHKLFLGRGIKEIFTHPDLEDIENRLTGLAQEGGTWLMEMLDYTAGNQLHTFELHAFQTEPGEVAVAFLDITDRKSAEKALKDSERRFREFVEGTDDLVTQVDGAGRLTYVNQRSEKFFGLPSSVCVGRIAFDFVHPEDRQHTLESFQKWMRERTTSAVFENRVRATDGRVHHLLWSTHFHYDQSGEVLAVNSIAKDVTELKTAQRALKQADENWRGLFDAITDPVVILDPDLRIVQANRSARALAPLGGMEQKYCGDVMGCPAALSEAPPKDHGTFCPALNTLKTGQVSRRSVDGLEIRGRWLDVLTYPIFDSMGSVRQVVYFARDITEIKKSQSELVQAKEKAETANRAKTEFLANVSHELRTPLNGIVGFTELAMECCGDPGQVHFLEEIKTAAHRLSQLVNDLIELSRIEADGVRTDPQPFSLAVVVKLALEGFRQVAAAKQLGLTSSIDPGIPEFLIGDPHRIVQILGRLLENGIKFTERGEVRVAAAMERKLEQGVEIHVAVTDTGIGIPEELMNRIFHDFSQADGSMTRKFGGIGLGLTMARKLVASLGGRIWPESLEDVGTTLHVVLPFSTVDSMAESRAQSL